MNSVRDSHVNNSQGTISNISKWEIFMGSVQTGIGAKNKKKTLSAENGEKQRKTKPNEDTPPKEKQTKKGEIASKHQILKHFSKQTLFLATQCRVVCFFCLF